MESEELDSLVYAKLQESLKMSSPEQLQISVATLIKLLQNILDHPEDPKYRSIKRTNKAIQSRLLSTPGITELLGVIRFQPVDNETLTLQDISTVEVPLVILQAFESEVKDLLKTEEEKDNEKRQLEIRKQAKEKEEAKKRLLQQAALDRKETKDQLMPTQDSHAIKRAPCQAKTFKDIGVDLNARKGG
jgi:PUB domain